MDNEIAAIFRLFFDGTPVSVQKIETGLGDDDFRMVRLWKPASTSGRTAALRRR